MREIPQFALPAGYHFRGFRPGDDRTWTAIVRAAEPFQTIADDLFGREYLANAGALPERMFFVATDAGDDVATISAWWQSDWRNPHDAGRIHWVAVRPDHQGRGPSKAMMTQAMNCLARHHDRAMLATSSGRVWAIKVYLDFGFLPDPQQLDLGEVAAAWRQLQDSLHHPRLVAALSGDR
ncbi:MAG: GNAT family N-acetyltransferase [Caldilineaceae bacterium]|nr:GNAT family N-acetyltransferase [Caldilineaceae bacterium]